MRPLTEDEDRPQPRKRRPTRRGDNIPPISDYAHWNEEAAAMWYAENRYDMEHWDEPAFEFDEPDD